MLRKLALPIACLFIAAPAQAQLVVMGNGAPYQCYKSADNGNSGTISAIQECTEALRVVTGAQDTAATHVNRGILFMRAEKFDKAQADFERALKRRPDLPEAHVNYGAALIRLNRAPAALESLNFAVANIDADLKPEALYNRAIAHDRLGNVKQAYLDLREALTLRPGWDVAEIAISGYSVQKRGA